MNLDKINTMYGFLFNIPDNFVPFKANSENSVQLIPKAGVILKDPLCGYSLSVKQDKIYVEDRDDGIIIKGVIGYPMMEKIESNLTQGCLLLSVMINEMLYQAFRYKKSDTKFQLVSFDIPGAPGQFFRTLEGYAGFELRLYVKF